MSARVDDEELKDVSKVVENLDSIMKGLNSKDESERREAMARSEKFLAEREKQKKAKSGSSEAEGSHVTADRTVVNKMDECAELEAYRKAVEADAAERAARRRSREQNATRLKDDGNAAFKGGNYELAVAKYSEGLEEMPWNTALYTNRAQAYCKLGDLQKAVEDCDKALEIDDRCIKALVHRGNAQVALEKFDEAIKSYERAVRVAPLKQEKTIKGYIEKAEEAREAAMKEKTALDSQSRGELESTTLLEMLKVLSRDDLPKQHIVEAARTLALSIGSEIQRTLFRAQGGFYTLLGNKFFEERDPDVVQSVLDCIYAVCTGDNQNENTLLSIKSIGDVFGDLLVSTCPVVTSSAAALIHILSMNVHSRTRLIAIMSKSGLFHGLVSVIDYCSAGTTNAVETFANFALEKGFRGLMSTPINETLVPALEKLVNRLLISYGSTLPGDQSSTIVHGCFTVLANVSVENAVRRGMAIRKTTWENALKILEVYRASADNLKTLLVLRTVLGLLMNLALEATEAMESVSKPLMAATIHYISSRSDEVIERSCGVLSRLLSSYSDQLIPEVVKGTIVHQLSTIAKSMLASPLKEPASSHAVRCLALLVQRNKEAREVVMKAGGVHAMVEMLKVKDESIVGNAALCIGSCAEDKTISVTLVDSPVVPRLLHHAKEAFGVVQQNCAVALAKLASSDDRHLEKLRALHGIEILQSRMK